MFHRKDTPLPAPAVSVCVLFSQRVELLRCGGTISRREFLRRWHYTFWCSQWWSRREVVMFSFSFCVDVFQKNSKCMKDKMTSPTWIALFGLFIQWFSTRSSWYFWLGWKVGSGHEILWLSFAYYGTLTKRAIFFERPRRKATRNPGPKEQQMPSYLVKLEILL